MFRRHGRPHLHLADGVRQPARDLFNGNGGLSLRLASIEIEAIASGQRMFLQPRPDITTMFWKASGTGAVGGRLAAMADDGGGWGQPGHEWLAGAFLDPHDRRGYHVARQ